MTRKLLVCGMIAGVLILHYLTIGAAAPSATGVDLPWHTIAAGTGSPSSDSYTLSGTLGQSAVGDMVGANHGLGAGYWTSILVWAPSQPTMIALPIILKTSH